MGDRFDFYFSGAIQLHQVSLFIEKYPSTGSIPDRRSRDSRVSTFIKLDCEILV